MAKVGLLGKAKAGAAAKPVAKRKQTAWEVGAKDAEEGVRMANAVKEICDLQVVIKANSAKQDVLKSQVKSFAQRNYVRDMCATGVPPETPMLVVNRETGQSVTFVVQERTGSGLNDEQVEMLEDLLGKDAAAKIVYDETTFKFNPLVLAQPVANGERDEETSEVKTISDVLNEVLTEVVESLAAKGVMSEAQVESLLQVDVKRAIRPGTVDQAAIICGQDTTKVEKFLDALGSSAVRYVKS